MLVLRRSWLLCGAAFAIPVPVLAQSPPPATDPNVAPAPVAVPIAAKRVYTAADFARFAPKTA